MSLLPSHHVHRNTAALHLQRDALVGHLTQMHALTIHLFRPTSELTSYHDREHKAMTATEVKNPGHSHEPAMTILNTKASAVFQHLVENHGLTQAAALEQAIEYGADEMDVSPYTTHDKLHNVWSESEIRALVKDLHDLGYKSASVWSAGTAPRVSLNPEEMSRLRATYCVV